MRIPSVAPFYWRRGSGNNIYRTDGNVGVGLDTDPQAKLHVVGNVIADSPTADNHLTTKGYVDVAIEKESWQDAVLDQHLTDPPGAPTIGDRYIIASVATGDWTGHEEKITEWDGSSWEFFTPEEGWSVWVEDEDAFYTYNASYPAGSWARFGTTVLHANLLGLDADDHHNIYYNKTLLSSPLSPQVTSGGVISEGTNSGTIQHTSLIANLRVDTADDENLAYVTKSAEDNITIPLANTLYRIILNYNSGSPTVSLSTTPPNGQTTIPIGKCYRESDNTVHYTSCGWRLYNGVARLHRRASELRDNELVSGGALGSSGTRCITIGSSISYKGINRLTTGDKNTNTGDTFVYVYRDGGGGWTFDDNGGAGYTQINNTKFDDGDGVLGDLQANKYGTHWVYLHAEDEHIYIIYGQYGTDTFAEAEAREPLSGLHELVSGFGILLGKIIVKKGADVLYPYMVKNTSFGVSATADHGNLAGLNDVEDHLGYLLLDGTRVMTGDLDVGTHNIFFDETDDPDTYIHRSAADTLNLVTGGTSRVQIGNTGVGLSVGLTLDQAGTSVDSPIFKLSGDYTGTEQEAQIQLTSGATPTIRFRADNSFDTLTDILDLDVDSLRPVGSGSLDLGDATHLFGEAHAGGIFQDAALFGDDDRSHYLVVYWNESETSDDRELTLYVNGGNKALSLEGDTVLDQDYSSDASPSFAGINLSGDLNLDDGQSIHLGSSDDSLLQWDTGQTPHTLYLGLGSDSNHIVIGQKADITTDFGHAQQTDPTIFLHSADATDATQWLSLAHDQSHGVLETGKGNFLLKPAGDMVLFGGATSDYPALKRVGTSLRARLGDDSVGCSIYAFGVYSDLHIRAGANGYVAWAGRSEIYSPVDGDILFTDTATTGFNSLQLGPARTTDAAPSDVSLLAPNAWSQATGANQTGGNLNLAGGIGTRQVTIVDYTGLAGETVTVTIDGSANALVEGVDWNAATSNDVTATNLAAAIDGLSGNSASATGAVVYITPDADLLSLDLASTDVTDLTLTEGDVGGVNIYSPYINGDLRFSPDGTYEIGPVGTNRPKNIYASNVISAINQIYVSGSGVLRWSGRSEMWSPADGKLKFTNDAIANGVTLDFSSGSWIFRNQADDDYGEVEAGNIKSHGQIWSDIASTLTPSGTTQTIDFSDSNVQVLDLEDCTGDVTVTFANGQAGGIYWIKIIQDSAVARDVVWTNVEFPGGVVPVISAGANDKDLFQFVCISATEYLGGCHQDYS